MTHHYAVNFSGLVREYIHELSRVAIERGDGDVFAAALAEFIRRLRIYPQFGDPLSDLTHQVGHIRLGVVPPLSMRYGVLEDHRVVFVAARPILLARATPRDGA